MLPNIPNYLLYFRDDMRLATWILWGAFLQSLLGLFLPRYVAFLPTAIVLATRLATASLRNGGFLPNDSQDNVRHERLTAQIPNEDGSFPRAAAAKDIVVFIIATRSSHPKGRFAPGLDEITNYFRACWQDAAANREKWGYLGKTPTLIATEEDSNNVLVWISYWKSVEGLQAFAQGDVHRPGWDWWDRAKHSHIGIQHELYYAPMYHWENIAHNFRPFGIGKTKHIVKDNASDEGARLISPLRATVGSDWKSMKARMGQTDQS